MNSTEAIPPIAPIDHSPVVPEPAAWSLVLVALVTVAAWRIADRLMRGPRRRRGVVFWSHGSMPAPSVRIRPAEWFWFGLLATLAAILVRLAFLSLKP